MRVLLLRLARARRACGRGGGRGTVAHRESHRDPSDRPELPRPLLRGRSEGADRRLTSMSARLTRWLVFGGLVASGVAAAIIAAGSGGPDHRLRFTVADAVNLYP